MLIRMLRSINTAMNLDKKKNCELYLRLNYDKRGWMEREKKNSKPMGSSMVDVKASR